MKVNGAELARGMPLGFWVDLRTQVLTRAGAPALMRSLPARRSGRGCSGTRACARSDIPRTRRAHRRLASREIARGRRCACESGACARMDWDGMANVGTRNMSGMSHQCGRGALRAPAVQTRD